MGKGSTATDVAKKDQLPATSYDYGDYSGAGFENQGREDYSIPFLTVLQGLSPQLETVDGAKPGMIINTVTNDIFKGTDGIVFVPAWTEHNFIEYVPRDQGGGFVGVHAIDSDVVERAKSQSDDFGKYYTEGGNELIETFSVYGLRLNAESGAMEQAVIAFTSTKIKKYKQWMTKAKMIQINLGNGRRIQAPLPAHRYLLKTVKEKNKHGEFWNWEVAFDGATAADARLAPDHEAFQEAINVMTLVKSGAARAAHETATPAADGESGGKRDPEADKTKDKAPF